jgi:hypothetical protein
LEAEAVPLPITALRLNAAELVGDLACGHAFRPEILRRSMRSSVQDISFASSGSRLAAPGHCL